MMMSVTIRFGSGGKLAAISASPRLDSGLPVTCPSVVRSPITSATAATAETIAGAQMARVRSGWALHQRARRSVTPSLATGRRRTGGADWGGRVAVETATSPRLLRSALRLWVADEHAALV